MPNVAETAAGSRDHRQDVSAPGVLARVERSAGQARWRPKRSCRPWTPTVARRTLPGIGEGLHRYMPWCRVVWPVTGARGRLGSVVAVALRIG